MSTTAATRQIVQQYHECWKAHDIEGILALYSPDIEYYDYFANVRIPLEELRDYIELSLPRSKASAIRHNDRIRADGDTAFLQYTYTREQSDGRVLTYQNAEAITVRNHKIIRINEYASLIQEAAAEQTTGTLQRLGLNDERCQILADEMADYFQQQKPFLDPQLTLADVAENLGYTRNQISFVLNQHIGQSFYDYINSARVVHFLERELQGVNLTEAAYSTGFSSMSTFYKFFKRHTGQTPGKYFKAAKPHKPGAHKFRPVPPA
ncbi:helix-turn-helix domain-containing protein [Aestuariicella hydrocarbonica]|uniref:Helix-turn-helix domain-containing protein n=1 Tax=Pseudomaricurvus hydrocarbonicus TaxID=1470433 RepID=A0A9E5JSC3_9GAMM|nr:nuclear transport factor 2 family protein [Aestuariicella hydrocarbonica]NHO64429.1 helix-turn-helix domain-containing protein [Aestuariicella hydrocarbonica]